jgi:hypothetical protein
MILRRVDCRRDAGQAEPVGIGTRAFVEGTLEPMIEFI